MRKSQEKKLERRGKQLIKKLIERGEKSYQRRQQKGGSYKEEANERKTIRKYSQRIANPLAIRETMFKTPIESVGIILVFFFILIRINTLLLTKAMSV